MNDISNKLFWLYVAVGAVSIMLVLLVVWEIAIVIGLWRSMGSFLEQVPRAAFGR